MRMHLLMILTTMTVCACGGAHDASTTAQAQPPNAAQAGKADNASPVNAQSLIAAYLVIHERLAADDAKAASAAFGKLRSAAQPTVIADATLRKRIEAAATRGSQTQDIGALRKAFHEVSDAVIAWLHVEPNPAAESLRLANCPMAFDTGAKWLQRGDQVQNPYYGSEMPHCGSIDATLAPGGKLDK